jgi:hypothetical protein
LFAHSFSLGYGAGARILLTIACALGDYSVPFMVRVARSGDLEPIIKAD